MRRSVKLSLALFLCAMITAEGRPALPAAAGARASAADGVNRRAPSRRRARGGRGGVRRDRAVGRVLRANSDQLPAGALLPPFTVTEVDAEGLKKLLSRGDDPAKARPLLVNFWATWCDPCREEMPDLVKIDAEFRPRGLDFVLVSADDVSEIKTGVPAFLGKMRATMPSYILNTPDVEAAMGLVDPKWGGELPATFLLDREGKIVFKHFGRVKLAELRPAIEKALGGK